MAIYCVSSELASPLRFGGQSSRSDTDMTKILTAASRWIDAYFCLEDNAFMATAASERFFDAGNQRGTVLRLDMPLLRLDSIVNGDSNPVDVANVIMTPRGSVPSMTLRINSGAWVASYVDAIGITGLWGYSTTVPDVVREATAILAVWMLNEFQTRRGVDGRTFDKEGDNIRTDEMPALLTTMLAPISANLKRLRYP